MEINNKFNEIKNSLEREALAAIRRNELIKSSFRKITRFLKAIHKILDSILDINPTTSKIDISKLLNEQRELGEKIIGLKEDNRSDKLVIKELEDKIGDLKKITEYPIFQKKRNKLVNLPETLWFRMHGILFYIDFTVRNSKSNKNNILEGCFTYGTSYIIEKEKVVDKPILSFILDLNNIISALSDFDNESWTINEVHIYDLHLRTLDKIWEEALFLINDDKIA